MREDTAKLGALVLVVAVLTAGVALAIGAGAVAAAENTTADDVDVDDKTADVEPADTEAERNDTDTDVDVDDLEAGLTLEELRQSGRQYDGSPDSARIDDGRIWWVVHWPADAIGATPGDPSDSGWRYLSPDDRVDRNAVYLRTIHAHETTEPVTVVVASYDVETRENETVATDVRVDTHELTYGPGWAMLEIPLRQADDTREVAMWIADDDGEPVDDNLRWHFEHRSVATTSDAGIASEGDYLTRALLEIVFPTLIGAFAIGAVCKRAIDRAGRGPMWGYGRWITLLVLAIGVLVLYQFSTLAELLTIAPYVVSAFVVGVFAIVILETYQADTKKTLFYRPVLRDAVSPSGEDAVDSFLGDMEEEMVIEGNGPPSVIRPGLFPFLARVYGARARLEGYQALETAIKLPSSDWDQLVIVHPDATDVIDYEPESWTLEVPEIDDRRDAIRLATIAVIGAGIVYAIASALSPVWAVGIGAIATAGYLATPVGGTARIEPAPGHLRAAFMSVMFLELELRDAETIEEARKEIVNLQVRSEREVDAALEAQDATIIEEMFGSDVDRRVRTGSLSTSANRVHGDGDDVDASDDDQETSDQEVTADD